MVCPKCGNQLPEDSKFCGSCGVNLTQYTSRSEDSDSEFKASDSKKDKKKLDAKKIVIILAVLLCSFIIGKAVGGGIAGIMNGSNSEPDSTTSSN